MPPRIYARRSPRLITYLSLNHEVYQALNDLSLNEVAMSGVDTATRHYLDRTLLQYRLAGVDKDEATRTRIRELHDQATMLSLDICPQRAGRSQPRHGAGPG